MFKEYMKSEEDGTLEQKYAFYTQYRIQNMHSIEYAVINEKYFSN